MNTFLRSVLTNALDHLWVGDRRDEPDTGVRSHLDDGRSVVWSPPTPPNVRLAVDAERRRRPPPLVGGLLRAGEGDDFWRVWTRMEVHCKLLDVPAVVALHGRPPVAALDDHRVLTVTFDVGAVVVTCGAARQPVAHDVWGGPAPREVSSHA